MSRRPAGATATLAAALVIVAGWFGANLEAGDAVILVAAATLIVSYFRPLPQE